MTTEITKNSKITMHFKIRIKDGTIAEDSRNYNRPFEFEMGSGVFTEKCENELLGLKINDTKKIMLLPQDAFGESHPALIYEVPLSRFSSDLKLEPGLIILFNQADGSERPGIIKELNDYEAKVDFNHPLAGQVVLFDIEILDIKEKSLVN